MFKKVYPKGTVSWQHHFYVAFSSDVPLHYVSFFLSFRPDSLIKRALSSVYFGSVPSQSSVYVQTLAVIIQCEWYFSGGHTTFMMSVIVPRLVELGLTMTLTFFVLTQGKTQTIQKKLKKAFNSRILGIEVSTPNIK